MSTLRKIIAYLHEKKIFYFLPVLPAIIVFIIFNEKLTVFPSSDEVYLPSTYCDGGEGGNSSISQRIEGSQFVFTFTLKKGNPYPYAGMSINFKQGGTYLDLSEYNYLSLSLSSENAKSCMVFLKTYMEGFTDVNNLFTYEFLMKEIPVHTDAAECTIHFKDLAIPPWWLEQNKLIESKLSSPDFSKTASIEIQNGTLTPFDTAVAFTVSRISFGKDSRQAYGLLLVSAILYYFLYVIFVTVLRKQKKSQVVIPYKELQVENDFDSEIRRLTECMARNYSDPDFSVEKLAREAGVSASKIPVLLKQKFDLNFKQYLNKIRIAEAKRLLVESDNQIVTVAYTVGYNNIPHFNRTFKQMEGLSPKEYRRKLKGDDRE